MTDGRPDSAALEDRVISITGYGAYVDDVLTISRAEDSWRCSERLLDDSGEFYTAGTRETQLPLGSLGERLAEVFPPMTVGLEVQGLDMTDAARLLAPSLGRLHLDGLVINGGWFAISDGAVTYRPET